MSDTLPLGIYQIILPGKVLKHWDDSFLIPFIGSASFPRLSNLFSGGKQC